MTKILFINSSPRGDASYSAKVGKALVERLQALHKGATVEVLDLFANPPSHIGSDFVGGIFSAPEQRTAAQQAAVARSDSFVQQFLAADILVIASGMINFGIPSTLKAWVDHISRAGVTFKYTETGPVGLVTDKKAYLVEARGGVYSSGPAAAVNFQDNYLRAILGFLGVTVEATVAIEGVAYGPEAAEKAVAGALESVKALAA